MGRGLSNDENSDFVIDNKDDSGNDWEASQRSPEILKQSRWLSLS